MLIWLEILVNGAWIPKPLSYLFKYGSSYKNNHNEEQFFMGYSSTSKIEGRWKIVLCMISGKEIIFNNVRHTLEIYKNMVSRSMLSNNGFKVLFESNKFLYFKNGVYARKGVHCDVLFKFNVMTIIPTVNEIACVSETLSGIKSQDMLISILYTN